MDNNMNIKLTGVLVGDNKRGFTTFFKEFPDVIGSGDTRNSAIDALFSNLGFYFRTSQKLNGEERSLPPDAKFFTASLDADYELAD